MSSSPSSLGMASRPLPPIPGPGRKAIRGGLFKALKRTIRHRWLLGFLCLLSLGIGYVTARVYGTVLWEANLGLMYLPEPGSRVTLPLVLDRTGHPEVIKATIAKVDENLSRRIFHRNFSAAASPTNNLIWLKMKWTDPDTAKALLSAMVDPLEDSLKDPQTASAGANGDDRAAQLAKLNDELAKLRKAKQEDLKNAGVSDLAQQKAEIKESIANYENLMQKNRVSEVTAKEQYKEVLRQLEDLKKTAAREADEGLDEADMVDSIADNRRRQDRIRELLSDEKERIALSASLEAKLKEKKQLDDLYKQGKDNRESLVRLDSEIYVLKAKLEGSRTTVELENEMRKIDHLIVPRKGKRTATSPIITQMLDKKMERELFMVGLAQEFEHCQKELDAQRAKLAHLNVVEVKSNEWDNKIADREKNRVEVLAQSFSSPSSPAKVRKLVAYGEPSTDQFPTSSNRPTIFTAVFLSGSGLSLLAILLYELVMGIRLPADVAKSLRIPVRYIAAHPAYAAVDYRDVCRAVRNQGFLARTVLQIQPLHPGDEARTNQAIEGLARAFSERGEKTLVVELGQSDPAIAGLADMLLAPNEPIDRFIQITTDAGTAHIIAGKQPLTVAQLAAPELRTVLENALNSYPVILIQGKGLQATREVEALGLNTDGLVLLSNGNRKIDPVAREALLDLTAENLVARAMVIV